MVFAEASERLQIVQAVLTFVGTLITALLAYLTVRLQAQAAAQGQRLERVGDAVREVKSTTDGITQRLVETAERAGVERGKREVIEKQNGTEQTPE